MKILQKIILSIIVLELLAFMLIGCGRTTTSTGFIVGKIRVKDNGKCLYIRKHTSSPIFVANSAIIDTYGKFNIGDTIKFTK